MGTDYKKEEVVLTKLKHSLIPPCGDFLRNSNDLKTGVNQYIYSIVIPEEELVRKATKIFD